MATDTHAPAGSGNLDTPLPTFAATLRAHPKTIVLAGIVAVASVIGAFASFQSLVDFTRGLFTGHVDSAGRTIDPVAAGVVVLLTLFAAAISGAMVTFARLYKTHGERIQTEASVQLAKMRARVADVERRLAFSQVLAKQTELIANRLHPRTGDMIAKVSEVVYTLTVDQAGGATVTRVDHLKADKVSVLRTVHTMRADERATPMPLLADIAFKIKDRRNDTAVAYLPLHDMPHDKEVAVFYLPYIDASEDEPRIADSSYYWEGMMTRLVEDGEDEWVWTLLSSEPVKEFTARFFFHPALGAMTCQLLGPERASSSMVQAQSDSGWMGWAFSMRNAPASSSEYRFRIRRSATPPS